MKDLAPLDDALLRRLPLPLAQLLRRAHNAKTPLERHLTAFRCWEASLKLLSMAALVTYARRDTPDDALTERLRNLARPSLGHWWEFARLLLPWLAERGEEPYCRLRDLLLGGTRDDLPRAAGLDAHLRRELEGATGARATVRLAELFDRLVAYRNKVLGHGAAERLPEETHRRLGAALLAGIAEFLDRLDVLAGRRLVYLGGVLQSGGVALVERYELMGQAPWRVAPLELVRDQADRPPDGERLYLAANERPEGKAAHDAGRPEEKAAHDADATGPDGLTPLHPLLIYDADVEEVLFLNARRSPRRAEYLGYSTGRHPVRDDLGGARLRVLADLLETERPEGKAAHDAGRPEGKAAHDAEARELGEFELLSELGRGGMGVVYRARQPSLDRQVALKQLLRTGDRTAEARFRREIRALAKVEHPHVVKIFTSGSDGEQWFYAMELVEGVPLSAVTAALRTRPGGVTAVDLPAWRQAVGTAFTEARKGEKPLSDSFAIPAVPEAPALPSSPAGLPDGAGNERPEGKAAHDAGRPEGKAAHEEGRPEGKAAHDAYVRQVVLLMRQTAEALEALHQRGIVHRDVKPCNILVNAAGEHATLMDLGLAQLADDAENKLTRTRQFVGTLRYASPEQVLAAGPLTAASDVYSLGVTLWEALTLRPMFGTTEQTPTADLMRRIPLEEPEPIRKYHPQVAADLEAVVQKCLEKDARRRYATAAALADDLGRFLDGEPVTARPVGRLVRIGRWWRRRPPMLAALAAAVVALVCLAVAAFAWLNRSAGPEPEGPLAIWVQREARGRAEVFNLESALPLHTGDTLRVRCRLPPAADAAVFWFDTEGHVREVPAAVTRGEGQDQLAYPPSGTVQVIGPPGTEFLLICARRSGPIRGEQVKALFAGDRPWPALPGRLYVLLKADRVELGGPRGVIEDAGASDPVVQVEQRLESLRLQLRKEFEFVAGVAFAHE